MAKAVVTEKGQIVIPSKIRRRMKIGKGTKLHIEERENEIVIRPVTSEYIRKVVGVLEGKGRLSKALLDERKRDREKEA